MGLNAEYARPDWMIITVLPVPPPPVRPSIQMDGAGRGEDDLTHKLADILKANQNVRRCESEGQPAHVISEFETLLQVSNVDDAVVNVVALIVVAITKLYATMMSFRFVS